MSSPRSRGSRTAPRKGTVPPDDLTPAPVVLVTGSESLLADRAVAAVLARARAADPELSVQRVEAAGYEAGRLALLTGPSLFGGGTLVVVEGVEATNDAFVKDMTAYLAAPAPDACVVVRHGGGQRARGLLEAVRATGAPESECRAPARDDEKADFVTAEFRRLGGKVSPQAVRALVDAVGSDLRELASACARVADDAGAGNRVEADHVERWFGGRVEATGFRVADAAVAGHADQALALLRHAVATGVDPVPLVAALALKVRAIAKVSAAGRGGRAADLGMAPWQVDRARRELAGWTEEGLAAAITAIAEADAGVKGADRDPVYAVERAVLTIARSRGAAAR